MTGIFLWGNILVVIVKILEHTDFSAGLEIYFLGVPLVIALVLFDKDKRVELLVKNINNFQRGEEVALQIRYFLHLVMSRDHDKRSDILLKGYIFHHEDSCLHSECQLKIYK